MSFSSSLHFFFKLHISAFKQYVELIYREAKINDSEAKFMFLSLILKMNLPFGNIWCASSSESCLGEINQTRQTWILFISQADNQGNKQNISINKKKETYLKRE